MVMDSLSIFDFRPALCAAQCLKCPVPANHPDILPGEFVADEFEGVGVVGVNVAQGNHVRVPFLGSFNVLSI